MEANFWRDCPLVEVIPGKLNGRPLIKDTRVEADLIAECEELGETAEETAGNYGLKLEDVLAIRAYVASQITSPLVP